MAIAIGVREPVVEVSQRLHALVVSGTAPLGSSARRTGEYWVAMAELLDVVVANELEIAASAVQLGISTGALSKLLLHDDHIGRAINELRRARGMRQLRH